MTKEEIDKFEKFLIEHGKDFFDLLKNEKNIEEENNDNVSSVFDFVSEKENTN